jgi:hypothetical protein
MSDLLQPGGSSPPKFVLLLEASFVIFGAYAAVRCHRRYVYLLAMIVGQAFFILKSGGDWMPGERFLAAAAVPFIIIEAIGMSFIGGWIARRVPVGARRTPFIVLGVLLPLTSIIPFTGANAPAWRIAGLSDQSLISTGLRTSFAEMAADLPATLRCLKSGELVATSEIGYLGFSRQDLRILDLRGLADSHIARDSPYSMKSAIGVDDHTWYLSSGPVGRELVRRRPNVIVEVDSPPRALVLGGQYHLVKVVNFGGLAAGFYVPLDESGVCAT